MFILLFISLVCCVAQFPCWPQRPLNSWLSLAKFTERWCHLRVRGDCCCVLVIRAVLSLATDNARDTGFTRGTCILLASSSPGSFSLMLFLSHTQCDEREIEVNKLVAGCNWRAERALIWPLDVCVVFRRLFLPTQCAETRANDLIRQGCFKAVLLAFIPPSCSCFVRESRGRGIWLVGRSWLLRQRGPTCNLLSFRNSRRVQTAFCSTASKVHCHGLS